MNYHFGKISRPQCMSMAGIIYMTSTLFHPVVNVLVFLLPVMAVWIPHAASTILILLALLGLRAWFVVERKIKFNWPEKAVMISFAAILAMGLLSVPFHWLSPDNFQSDFQYDHEIKLLLFIPIYFLFVHSDLKPKTFWFGLCAGAVFAGAWSSISFYLLGTSGRIVGAYNPILLGDMSVAIGFASLAGIHFFEKKQMAMILIPIAAVLMGLAAAFLSGTRGALIAVPLLLLVFWIQIGNHSRAWTFRILLIGLIIAVFLGGYFLSGSSLDERVRDGLHTITDTFIDQNQSIESAPDFSTAARLRLWKEAIEIIGTHPWIGVGDDGFEHILKEKAKIDPSLEPITKFGTTHNMYLQFMTIYGIFGLPVILALFLTPLILFVLWIRQGNEARDFAYAGVVVVLAFMQFSLTESLMERSIPIAIYVVFIAATMALCKKNELHTTFGDG